MPAPEHPETQRQLRLDRPRTSATGGCAWPRRRCREEARREEGRQEGRAQEGRAEEEDRQEGPGQETRQEAR